MSNTKLKFRAWSYKESKFYTRVLVGDTEIDDPCSSVWSDEKKEWVHFDKHCGVIQQFTGLKDKNGKEIFEGDIVNVKRFFTRPYIKDGKIDYKTIDGELETGQVIWWEFQATFLVEYKGYDEYGDLLCSSVGCEVIGNIFENCELL